ncbi:uncharacterized protein METZ01_LOCUS454726 [marine metagenome]|mgnify:FL=1|uniref:Uncharacterized protein n=1 Tax=marine metagenome TaxID=408172 RepID=A0A383A292_9ZZZZ
MLGDKIGSCTATATNKALPSHDGALPSFETTAEGSGTLAGAEVTIMATYDADMKADGTLDGECPNSGVVMAQDGVATFKANGLGTFNAEGGVHFVGSCYFQASAPSLSSLNGKCIVYEWDVTADGAATWELWEWN